MGKRLKGLYERVSWGNVFYLDRIERDAGRGTLTFFFLGNPDLPDVVRVLEFRGVRGLSELREAPTTENLIGQLIGIQEEAQADGVRYEVILDEAVLWFTSDETPRVTDLVPFAPFEL